MTYKGNLVVDAVAHAYDSSEDNYLNEHAREFNHSTFHHTRIYTPEQYQMSEEQFFKDVTVEELERVLFLESDVDFVVNHSLPLYDFFADGLSSMEKAVELRDRNPNRVAIYGDINPLADDVIEDLEYKANELDVDGIKIYPARFEDGQSLEVALKDDTGLRMLERANELGVDTVAVHKSLPVGPTPTSYYEVGDVDEVAGKFPDINFEIVHAGFSFLEETVFLISKFPNVYANFEVTGNLMMVQPRKFAKILGEMLMWAGPEKILFASGCNFTHPQPLIETLWDWDFPEDMKEEYGYPDLTDDVKERILGLNALDMHDIDPDELRDRIEGDEWERKRDEAEKPEPWSSIEM
jgi:predicted TIM-barrel fold metal-dependent hydrolase